jgi:signal peptidase II
VALVLALIMTTLLKLLLDFPRPSVVFGDAVRVVGEAEDHYSLPSGHATYAALIIGTLWPLFGLRLRFVLVLYLIMVGWSRIATGVHFPADVAAGWILGLACLAAASWLHVARSSNDNRCTGLSAKLWNGKRNRNESP